MSSARLGRKCCVEKNSGRDLVVVKLDSFFADLFDNFFFVLNVFLQIH